MYLSHLFSDQSVALQNADHQYHRDFRGAAGMKLDVGNKQTEIARLLDVHWTSVVCSIDVCRTSMVPERVLRQILVLFSVDEGPTPSAISAAGDPESYTPAIED